MRNLKIYNSLLEETRCAAEIKDSEKVFIIDDKAYVVSKNFNDYANIDEYEAPYYLETSHENFSIE